MRRDPDYVTASEIAAYHYCPESWRLGYVLNRAAGNKAALRTGTRQHKRWQVTERRTKRGIRWALVVAAVAVVLAAFALRFHV